MPLSMIGSSLYKTRKHPAADGLMITDHRSKHYVHLKQPVPGKCEISPSRSPVQYSFSHASPSVSLGPVEGVAPPTNHVPVRFQHKHRCAGSWDVRRLRLVSDMVCYDMHSHFRLKVLTRQATAVRCPRILRGPYTPSRVRRGR